MIIKCKSDLDNTGLWKCVTAQTKEISKDLRRRTVDAHWDGNNFKRVCTLPVVRQVIDV